MPPAEYGPWFLRWLFNKDINSTGEKVVSYHKKEGELFTECSRMTVNQMELPSNITFCAGNGGHLWWGGRKYLNVDKLYKDKEGFEFMMEPDNAATFDVTDQILNFVCERSECLNVG